MTAARLCVICSRPLRVPLRCTAVECAHRFFASNPAHFRAVAKIVVAWGLRSFEPALLSTHDDDEDG